MDWDEVIIEASKIVLSLVAAAVFGQRIVVFWERRKKQSEMDLATLAQLHRMHAEFRTIGRLWRSFAIPHASDATIPIPDDLHWELQQRAAATEGEMEALVVKLATERVLNGAEIDALAFLREAHQLLRRSIRDRKWFYWKSGSEAYDRSYRSVVQLAAVISRNGKIPDTRAANHAIDCIRTASERLLDEPWFRPLAVENVKHDSPGSRAGSASAGSGGF